MIIKGVNTDVLRILLPKQQRSSHMVTVKVPKHTFALAVLNPIAITQINLKKKEHYVCQFTSRHHKMTQGKDYNDRSILRA